MFIAFIVISFIYCYPQLLKLRKEQEGKLTISDYFVGAFFAAIPFFNLAAVYTLKKKA